MKIINLLKENHLSEKIPRLLTEKFNLTIYFLITEWAKIQFAAKGFIILYFTELSAYRDSKTLSYNEHYSTLKLTQICNSQNSFTILQYVSSNAEIRI